MIRNVAILILFLLMTVLNTANGSGVRTTVVNDKNIYTELNKEFVKIFPDGS